MRGEYSEGLEDGKETSGSPPLARGVQPLEISAKAKVRITPACAGSTLAILLLRYLSWDHPRLRGEYRQSHIHTAAYPGSPPLARGVPSSDDCDLVQEGITPACAGSTTLLQSHPYCFADHPRLRGEYCGK